MELKWDLKELFSSDEEFNKEVKTIYNLTNDFVLSSKDLTITNLKEFLDKEWFILKRANIVLIYGYLRYYEDVNNKTCLKFMTEAQQLDNYVKDECAFVDKFILSFTKERIYQIKDISIYRFYIAELFRRQEHVKDKTTNKEITKSNDFINLVIKRYNETIKNISYGSIRVNDEELTITPTNLGKYLSSKDEIIRQKVYKLVAEKYSEKADIFKDILNNIIKTRKINADKKSYQNVLEEALFTENIPKSIIDTLITVTNKNIYLIREYLKIKTEFMGIKNPHLYDLGVPMCTITPPTYNIEEAITIIKEALKPLGPKYLGVVDILLTNHINGEVNEKKHQSITFSWYTYSFLQFNGSYNSLKNLIHELGHIVNDYMAILNEPFMYYNSPVFTGEIVSLMNEILLNKYLYEHSKTKEEKIFYLSKNIESYFTTVFKQVMYTEFENFLYNSENDFTTEKLNLEYKQLIEKYYGNEFDMKEEAFTDWTRLGHIYRWAYYPFKYATGLIMANIVVDSLNNKTLTEGDYCKFLSLGSSVALDKLLEVLHIDLANEKIVETGFKKMETSLITCRNLLKDDIC